MTATANHTRGLEMAKYQTRGFETDPAAYVATVQAWRREARTQRDRVRTEAKRDLLNGFISGLNTWLADNGSN